MECKPKQGPGIWLAAALIAGMLALDGLVLYAIWHRQIDITTFLVGLWLALSVPFTFLVGYLLYGLVKLSYHVDRNKLEIRWPATWHIVPLSAIKSIRPRDPNQKLVNFRGLRWPGLEVGYGAIEGLGSAWFCATRHLEEQWVMVTPSLAYVLSPADPQCFARAIEERKALGPTREVEQAERRAAFLTWPLWRDRFALGLIGVALLLNIVLFAHVSSQYAPRGLRLAEGLGARIMQLPLLGLGVVLLNIGLGATMYRRQQVGAYLLFAAIPFVQALLWRAAIQLTPPSEGARLVYRLIAGLFVAALIGWFGYQKKALSRSGVIGALIVGTTIFGFGGWIWGLLLIAFFLSSSFLSRYREHDKEPLAEKFAKGAQRDIGQALANGGLGAVLAVVNYLWPRWFWFPAFLGAISAVNADTWATEIGVLSKNPPHLMTTRQRVPVGTSGAVTPLGLIASLFSGLFIGFLALLLLAFNGFWRRVPFSTETLWLPAIGVIGGIAGSLVDSFLGATAQGIYYCERCQKETESSRHRCGEIARHVRGWRWLSNDLVNLISSVCGGLAAVIIASLMG